MNKIKIVSDENYGTKIYLNGEQLQKVKYYNIMQSIDDCKPSLFLRLDIDDLEIKNMEVNLSLSNESTDSDTRVMGVIEISADDITANEYDHFCCKKIN